MEALADCKGGSRWALTVGHGSGSLCTSGPGTSSSLGAGEGNTTTCAWELCAARLTFVTTLASWGDVELDEGKRAESGACGRSTISGGGYFLGLPLFLAGGAGAGFGMELDEAAEAAEAAEVAVIHDLVCRVPRKALSVAAVASAAGRSPDAAAGAPAGMVFYRRLPGRKRRGGTGGTGGTADCGGWNASDALFLGGGRCMSTSSSGR